MKATELNPNDQLGSVESSPKHDHSTTKKCDLDYDSIQCCKFLNFLQLVAFSCDKLGALITPETTMIDSTCHLPGSWFASE